MGLADQVEGLMGANASPALRAIVDQVDANRTIIRELRADNAALCERVSWLEGMAAMADGLLVARLEQMDAVIARLDR